MLYKIAKAVSLLPLLLKSNPILPFVPPVAPQDIDTPVLVASNNSEGETTPNEPPKYPQPGDGRHGKTKKNN